MLKLEQHAEESHGLLNAQLASARTEQQNAAQLAKQDQANAFAEVSRLRSLLHAAESKPQQASSSSISPHHAAAAHELAQVKLQLARTEAERASNAEIARHLEAERNAAESELRKHREREAFAEQRRVQAAEEQQNQRERERKEAMRHAAEAEVRARTKGEKNDDKMPHLMREQEYRRPTRSLLPSPPTLYEQHESDKDPKQREINNAERRQLEAELAQGFARMGRESISPNLPSQAQQFYIRSSKSKNHRSETPRSSKAPSLAHTDGVHPDIKSTQSGQQRCETYGILDQNSNSNEQDIRLLRGWRRRWRWRSA